MVTHTTQLVSYGTRAIEMAMGMIVVLASDGRMPAQRPPCAINTGLSVAWGYSSVGRASRSHREGQGFESPYLHLTGGPAPSPILQGEQPCP